MNPSWHWKIEASFPGNWLPQSHFFTSNRADLTLWQCAAKSRLSKNCPSSPNLKFGNIVWKAQIWYLKQYPIRPNFIHRTTSPTLYHPQKCWIWSRFGLLATIEHRPFAFYSELALRAFWDLDLEQNWTEHLVSFNLPGVVKCWGKWKVTKLQRSKSYLHQQQIQPPGKHNSCFSRNPGIWIWMKLFK